MIAYWADSQFLAQDYPTEFLVQCNWVANNAARLGIKILLHGGDVVDNADQPYQWVNADSFIDVLDTVNLPYLITTGNHDLDGDSSIFNAAANYPQTRYTGKSWWNGGFFQANHSETAYQLMTIDGIDYIFITIEYGSGATIMDWVDATLATYSTRKAIVVTHEYLDVDGTRTAIGDALWARLKVNDNIILILSGHVVGGDYMANRSDLSDGGKEIDQVLFSNMGPPGLGLTRFITINPVTKTISHQTFTIYGTWKVESPHGAFTQTYG